MLANKRWIVLAISAAAILGLAASAPAPSSLVLIKTPGGFLEALNGTLIAAQTGASYDVSLVAREADTGIGVGNVTLLVNGPSISVCSAHGPTASIDFSPGGEDFSGNNPLVDIQCGTAYGMTVHVDGCTAKVSLHGFGHSDTPYFPYMGPATVDLTFKQLAPLSTNAQVVMNLFTPKGPIMLKGVMSAPIQMDTCQ